MPKVSVIVPVFNPGERIDPLLDSLLGQSLPADEHELIFVDDGSTDGTGERLAALAEERDNVRTIRIENSGWPGRPRNVGLDAAQGEFVYFVDHDDYLGTEALERLYATAIADEADIVIGKVVGHRKAVPRSLFRENVHELGLRAAPFNLLTPHKLFRRALLDEHGIRFPEGKRRLEDHMFVVPAYFAARNMAILADYACYHWVHWDSDTNASFVAPDPAEYFDDVRGVLDVVDAHTEPGEFRDNLYGRWYRGKLLGRLGRNAFLGREEEHRRGVLAAVRELIEERFPERLDAELAPALRLRATLARRDDYDGLVALAEYERGLRSVARVRRVRGDGAWMTLETECWLRERGGEPLRVRRRDGRLLLVLPDEVAGHFADAELDVTDALADAARVQLLLKPEGEETDWIVPVEAKRQRARGGRRRAGARDGQGRGADRADDRGRRDRAARPRRLRPARRRLARGLHRALVHPVQARAVQAHGHAGGADLRRRPGAGPAGADAARAAPVRARPAAPAGARPGLELRRERAQLVREQLRLLPCAEVAAARQLGPAPDVEDPVGERARRGDQVVREERHRGRHGGPLVAGRLALEVGAERRADRVRHPVERHVGEHVVEREAALEVAVAVAPRAELLDDPGGQAERASPRARRRRSSASWPASPRRRPRAAPRRARRRGTRARPP